MKAIVVNDDSSMRVLLKHRCHNPKGRLPADMPKPEWLTDLSHRTKVVAKPIYLLSSLSKNDWSFTKVDTIRFKDYFGYVIKSNRGKIIFEIMRASKTIEEHLFDNHEFCDERWCAPLNN